MGLINRIYSKFLSEEKFLEKITYNQEGYYVHSSRKDNQYKVTVVMPVYNAEKTLKKTIDSIINQTIGFKNIELIIVDDKSDDNSRAIILEYAKKYSNVVPVFLKENTGSPAKPRNLGMDLATGNYLMFIDADDWLDNNGIKILHDTLERTGDNYAIGRTIQVTDKKMEITGEYNSCETRDSIVPYTIPHLFQHLGPTARMMRTKFLKEHHFRFPNMKFAEDKQFFIDVLTNCPTISTSKEVVYYVNRYKENKSLVSTTTIFEKTDTNIAVIKHVIEKRLPEKIERMILNRLYEFDCITRLFNREHFLKSKQKEKYYEKFSEVLSTTKELRYDFTENFFEPWHKVLVNLFREERYDDIVTLIQWSLRDTTKETVIKDGLPYYRLPFDDKYQFTRIVNLAYHEGLFREENELLLHFKVYGDHLNELHSFVIRQRNNELNQIEFPIQNVKDNLYEVRLPFNQLSELSSNSYSMFIKYCNYRKLFIKMNTRRILNDGRKKMDFYTTIGDNFGLNIK